MKTFYIRTDEPDFSSELTSELQSRNFVESSKMPVDFMFMSGSAAYYKHKLNTKNTKLISMIYGESKDIITNKLKLHERFQFLNPSKSKIKILKPTEGFAGEGIKIIENESEIEEWKQKYPKFTEWQIQYYIQHPATLQGYKFHLRSHIMVQLKPYSVYISNKKVYYTASEKYTPSDWQNKKIHDTHFTGSENVFFPETLPDDWKTPGQSINKINEMFATIFAEERNFKPEWNAKNGFFIFGADVMFDRREPFIIEINGKTGLKQTTFIIPGIISILIDKKQHPDFTKII